MEMIPVRSSAITAIGYDLGTRRMAVHFKEGESYTYHEVPAEVFAAFLNSPSKGRFFAARIRDRYEFG